MLKTYMDKWVEPSARYLLRHKQAGGMVNATFHEGRVVIRATQGVSESMMKVHLLARSLNPLGMLHEIVSSDVRRLIERRACAMACHTTCPGKVENMLAALIEEAKTFRVTVDPSSRSGSVSSPEEAGPGRTWWLPHL